MAPILAHQLGPGKSTCTLKWLGEQEDKIIITFSNNLGSEKLFMHIGNRFKARPMECLTYEPKQESVPREKEGVSFTDMHENTQSSPAHERNSRMGHTTLHVDFHTCLYRSLMTMHIHSFSFT